MEEVNCNWAILWCKYKFVFLVIFKGHSKPQANIITAKV